ncbi:MAG: hypothetical protein JXR80_02150 [Deltaproteobacteria bacterium]|nr:hypothetical protein [Deltaproteobacteria bacterium]
MRDNRKNLKALAFIFCFLWLGAAVGCSHRPLLVDQGGVVFCLPPVCPDLTLAVAADITVAELAARYAPAFKIYEGTTSYNRIGRPALRRKADCGDFEVFVDPEKPVIFYEQSDFVTDRGKYSNLIYRVHFEKVPFSMLPFYVTAGRHPGLLVIVTLNQSLEPVLLTLVHTCGCYLAIIPTTALAAEAFPEQWKSSAVLSVYGEELPALLDYAMVKKPQLLVSLRPDVHRIMDLEIVAALERQSVGPAKMVPASLEPMARLDALVGGLEPVSFFHGQGLLQDHVKGALKPWETLLMSWFSLDLWVGMDKRLGSGSNLENPFYTSLKPWQRRASDMNDFPRFLQYWGWRL